MEFAKAENTTKVSINSLTNNRVNGPKKKNLKRYLSSVSPYNKKSRLSFLNTDTSNNYSTNGSNAKLKDINAKEKLM